MSGRGSKRWALFELGYYLATGHLKVPGGVVAFFLLGFTAVINFIDLKDYEGDQRAGIKTLPTLLGLEQSKIVIGSFFVLTYLSVYFLVGDTRVVFPSLIAGVLVLVLINRKRYCEAPVFIVDLISLVIAMRGNVERE